MLKEVAAGVIGLGTGIGLSYAFMQKLYNYQMKPDKSVLLYVRGVENLDGHLLYQSFAPGARQPSADGVSPEEALVAHWDSIKKLLSHVSAKVVAGYKLKEMAVWIISIRFVEAGQQGEMLMEIVTVNNQGVVAVRTVP